MSEFVDYQEIKAILENELCSIHNKHPQVEVTPNGFNFQSCCKEFNSELSTKATKLVAQKTTASLLSKFRN